MMQEDALLERSERRFRRDMWSVAPADAVTEAGVRMRWFGPVFASVFADLPHAWSLNLVQGATEPGAVAEGHLAAAVEWVRSWEVDHIVPVTSGRPETGPAERWLERHGYEQRAVVTRYVRPASKPTPAETPGVEVHGLPADEDELIGCLAAEGLGLPDLAEILFIGLPCLENWHCYVALLDKEIAATGSMMIDEGVATLGIDTTLPYARGHGCNRALLDRRIADAAAAGCHTVQSFAYGDLGQGLSAAGRNLCHAGFRETGRIVTWQLPETTSLKGGRRSL